jgi:phosphatidylethanolamine N-methyltransferase
MTTSKLVDRPTELESFESVYDLLLRTVTFALDLDPSISPQTSLPIIRSYRPSTPSDTTVKIETVDPEDFTIMSEDQASMISQAIKLTFDVDLGVEVVIADANVGRLAETVMEARRLLRPWIGENGQHGEKEKVE